VPAGAPRHRIGTRGLVWDHGTGDVEALFAEARRDRRVASDRQHRGVVGEPEFGEAVGDSPHGSADQRLDVATGRDADRGSSREEHPRELRNR